MAAVLHRFVSPADRFRRDEADRLRAVLASEREAAPVDRQFLYEAVQVDIDRRTASSREKEGFLLVYPEFSMVSEWLVANSSRKLLALRLWAFLLGHVDRFTGDVALSRDEIADALGAPVGDVSRVTSELVDCCALSRRRVRVPGMRGSGVVRYTLNPLVGTHLGNKLRQEARGAAPPLDLRSVGERRGRAPLAVVPVL